MMKAIAGAVDLVHGEEVWGGGRWKGGCCKSVVWFRLTTLFSEGMGRRRTA